MNAVTNETFSCSFGYISEREKEEPISQVYKKEKSLLNCATPDSQGKCLLFDNGGIPHVTTYDEYLQTKSSIFERMKAAYSCYTGELLHETREKIQEIWAEKVAIAEECVRVETTSPSLQDLRDRGRRLQVFEAERSLLEKALQTSVSAHEAFVKKSSYLQRGLFRMFAMFQKEPSKDIKSPVNLSPLSQSSEQFVGKYSIRLELAKRTGGKVAIVANVLKPVDFAELGGKRFATHLSIRDSDSGETSTCDIIRKRNRLITTCYGDKTIMWGVLQRLFLKDPAESIHVSDRTPGGVIFDAQKTLVSPHRARMNLSTNGFEVLNTSAEEVEIDPNGSPVLPLGDDTLLQPQPRGTPLASTGEGLVEMMRELGDAIRDGRPMY